MAEQSMIPRNEMCAEIALAQLKPLVDSSDYEIAHGEADQVLCDLLIVLGYIDVVAVWEKVGKWYA